MINTWRHFSHTGNPSMKVDKAFLVDLQWCLKASLLIKLARERLLDNYCQAVIWVSCNVGLWSLGGIWYIACKIIQNGSFDLQYVEQQFNAVFDGQVEEVHVCYNTRELDKLVSEYNSTLTKLQDQIDEYIRFDKLRKKPKRQKVSHQHLHFLDKQGQKNMSSLILRGSYAIQQTLEFNLLHQSKDALHLQIATLGQGS